ncbi:GNAT family N-acetyltransferase [Pseudomonas fluorescens]|jgi:ribosomal protein S18 acetylase RimI-like enzyme|uniref:GNAT family N-acetyltransferase n=1 Tax=Pseudomonas fluorescens TaxID=294 RepID=A0A423NVQ3_PSEFL|nr:MULTISPECIES: GNAT family N-acetyltransferase [Pseudomonas]OOH76629.1 GNAT family N-acetyltransferase [Pseudomonas koreensis]QUE89648.1 GNAT family N-acetyltransferase [Pseudomonas sp. SCA2728.1_7]ROO02397.1 GNAT family N-acetyltransferase [Pseudomonas fluorescens]TKJ82573.1 GNAT family N-acetyltransferase [Pseudomonas koreensis]WRH91624.1 GNAT family N-acetyltransferase [Pseudomonas fluorescens]
MRRDLGKDAPDAPWPQDIELRTYSVEMAADVHHLMQLGYREGGGRVPALDAWQRQFETDPEYDPSLCLIARDAEGVVGVAQCWTSAYIKNLVVHPRMQGRGLGRALLLNAFKVFQQRREGFVDLKVLEDNRRAQRLYESAGMYVVRRELVPD